jgi:hypothetical protein
MIPSKLSMMLCGLLGVGKSSLVLHQLIGRAPLYEEVDPSIEDTYKVPVKGEEEKIAVYDMTEWTDASALQIHTRREWMEENHCFIYCVDISKDEQMILDDFAKLREEVQRFGKKSLSEMPLLVVGMKNDLNRIDSSSFLLRLLQLSVNDFPHLESICCSAQTGEN